MAFLLHIKVLGGRDQWNTQETPEQSEHEPPGVSSLPRDYRGKHPLEYCDPLHH